MEIQRLLCPSGDTEIQRLLCLSRRLLHLSVDMEIQRLLYLSRDMNTMALMCISYTKYDGYCVSRDTKYDSYCVYRETRNTTAIVSIERHEIRRLLCPSKSVDDNILASEFFPVQVALN